MRGALAGDDFEDAAAPSWARVWIETKADVTIDG